MRAKNDFIEMTRKAVIGRNGMIKTPFGERKLTYADYTASGRGISFIEDYLRDCLVTYANTHTEDDATGQISTERLHRAEQIIKGAVNGGNDYALIATGTGATGAIHHLQQLLGVYISPATKDLYGNIVKAGCSQRTCVDFDHYLGNRAPVVFVGPYEHHSNEISWRECLAEVVEIGLDGQGHIDLNELESQLTREEFRDRIKIGSFSAASNVTGLKTPVYEIAALLHRNDALAFFDFAASAPYVEIDINRDRESFFDGIFFSSHKFMGGPGGAGILIIHKRIYNAALPPTIAGGGTVDYVNSKTQDYTKDIEVREKAGTPGILQTYKAALAMELKEKIGVEYIDRREGEILTMVKEQLTRNPLIHIVTDMSAETHLPIFSFNIKSGTSWLHPRFIVKLMNDLFGIQTRAGCSCAGPYGHSLLQIKEDISERYHRAIVDQGNYGLKPGWIRASFHYLMEDREVQFICDAILFSAAYGKLFLSLYDFDLHSGSWKYLGEDSPSAHFGLDEALGLEKTVQKKEAEEDDKSFYDYYMAAALELAEKLKAEESGKDYKSTQSDLISFLYV
jgi:selenocysteine lyase/cysteine desulfurase